MSETNEIIFEDDARAAQYKTASGWFSRLGRFWGEDEHMARYDGATHRKCRDCGATIPIVGLLVCRECDEKRRCEEFLKLELVEWDRTTPLMDVSGNFYFDDDDVQYEMSENGLSEMDFYLCEPWAPPEIAEDYFDILDEDGCDDLVDLCASLNAIIVEHFAENQRWEAGNKRVRVCAEVKEAEV